MLKLEFENNSATFEPINVLFEDSTAENAALLPTTTLLLELLLITPNASLPIAMLSVDVVKLSAALTPIAILFPPPCIFFNAS